MAIEVKLFEDPSYDNWRKKYWEEKEKNEQFKEVAESANSGSFVLKERDKGAEVKEFHDAQIQLSKDVLPEHTQSGALVQLFDQQYHRVEDFAKKDEMKPTPPQAFDVVYPMPFGNTNPESASQEPTSKMDLNKKGVLMLDVKTNTAQWIGDHYLPKQTQDYKDDYTPPQTQLSSSSEVNNLLPNGLEIENQCNKQEVNFASINVGELIEKALKNK
jgi:hypothetical protein